MWLVRFLLVLWQLPQNLVGLCYWCISTPIYKGKVGDVLVFETDSYNGSVSLGNMVFVTSMTYDYKRTLKHELGHTIQSKYLGWLYLLVIGIPSILWVCARRVFKSLREKKYSAFYTEAWADRLSNRFTI
jgi:hypothetical protein